jgi:hypothetical protein
MPSMHCSAGIAKSMNARTVDRRKRRADTSARHQRVDKNLRIVRRQLWTNRNLGDRFPLTKVEHAASRQGGIGDDDIVIAEIFQAADCSAPGQIGGRGYENSPAETDPPENQILLRRSPHANREIDILMDEIDRSILQHEVNAHGWMIVLKIRHNAM